jgi:hypothetical protein
MSNTLETYKTTLFNYIKANAAKIGLDANNVELISGFEPGDYNNSSILIRSLPVAEPDFLSDSGIPSTCAYQIQCLCCNSAASDEPSVQESAALDFAGRLATLIRDKRPRGRIIFANPPLFTFVANSTIGIVSVNLVANVDIFRPLLEVPSE